METENKEEKIVLEEESTESMNTDSTPSDSVSDELDGNEPSLYENENEDESDHSEDEAPTLDELINQYQLEKEEYQNKYLRTLAEFDNYRKRVLREKSDLILNGGERVITEILPVLDDIERAEETMRSSNNENSLNEGVLLIFEKLKSTLSRQGLTKIESVGETFNTDYHEAVAMVPGQPDDLRGKVIDCIQDGYKLNDKVIRHCKVAVAE